jgi:DNA-binding GntR family transcriptional regulator
MHDTLGASAGLSRGGRTLTGRVVRHLRQQIMLGELSPGEHLSELRLAEELNVSRSTVREALRRLESEYLIETIPHRGSSVANLLPSDAIEICQLHAMLESHCLRHLPLPIDEGLRQHLNGLVAQMRRLTFPAGADGFIDLDHEFHGSIVRAANQRWVLYVWSDINALLGIIVTLSIRYLQLDAGTIAGRHQALVDALSHSSGRVEAAAEAAQDHYGSLARMLEDIPRWDEREVSTS